MQIGKPLTVKCGVSDSQSGGVFTWKIGDEVIQSSGERKEADDRIVNSVEFVPEKKHAGLELVCEYTEGGQLYSDYITANIYLLDLPTSPVVVPQVEEGELATLHLTAGIYPPPRPDQILWTIKEVGGVPETILQPGNQVGRYRASQLRPLSLSDFYMLSLNISDLSSEEVAKTHELSITTSATKRTISFELSMRFRSEDGTESSPSDNNNQLSPKSGDEQSGVQVMSNSFIIVIVVVIVIVVLICICCFFYKRNKKEERKEEVLYTPVSTNSTQKAV